MASSKLGANVSNKGILPFSSPSHSASHTLGNKVSLLMHEDLLGALGQEDICFSSNHQKRYSTSNFADRNHVIQGDTVPLACAQLNYHNFEFDMLDHNNSSLPQLSSQPTLNLEDLKRVVVTHDIVPIYTSYQCNQLHVEPHSTSSQSLLLDNQAIFPYVPLNSINPPTILSRGNCFKISHLLKQHRKHKLIFELFKVSPKLAEGGKKNKKSKGKNGVKSNDKCVEWPSDNDISRMNNHHHKSAIDGKHAFVPLDAKEEAWKIVELGKHLGLSFSKPDEIVVQYIANQSISDRAL
ncbi:hypothetical protein GH714_031067 [Hevea brasiliensis]|uniref:Uncharacterized protein n=1 Tax=Hevea brasiliensis TaxID=3981 RepID=A0A6A6LDY6_HEVBR|nr:hypothetical protein GH714_031067 [Hevea brasiliensis]